MPYSSAAAVAMPWPELDEESFFDEAPLPRRTPLMAVPAEGVQTQADMEHAMAAQLRSWAQIYIQTALEVASGGRPPSQLVRWTSARLYDDLRRRGHLAALARQRRVGDPVVRRTVRPIVRTVRVQFVTATKAEISARAEYNDRSRAVAGCMRLIKGRWVCTTLEFC